MTLTPKIRTLAEHEWDIYKDLRLAALAESPDAFGSAFAKEAQRSNAEWANQRDHPSMFMPFSVVSPQPGRYHPRCALASADSEASHSLRYDSTRGAAAPELSDYYI